MSLELNSCVLIDYGLWAAKSEGRQWVDHCIEQCIKQCINHPPEPRSGLCPELLADFRIPNLLGARRGLRGEFFLQFGEEVFWEGGGVGRGVGWGRGLVFGVGVTFKKKKRRKVKWGYRSINNIIA